MTESSLCFHSPLLCLSCLTVRTPNPPQSKTKKTTKQNNNKKSPPHCSLNLARNEIKGDIQGFVAAYKSQSSPAIQIWTIQGTSAPCCLSVADLAESSSRYFIDRTPKLLPGQLRYRVEESKNKPTNQRKNKQTNKKALHFHQSMSVLSPEISVWFNQPLKSGPLE